MLESITMKPVIEIKDVSVVYRGKWPNRGINVQALKEVSLQVAKGEALGIVGESGSGKSTLGRVLLRLIKPENGEVYIEGCDPFLFKGEELQTFRRKVQPIFQDSGSSLNSRLFIGQSIREGLDIHRIGSKSERQERVVQLLKMVGLDESYSNRYPHTLSGGQRQRVNIARALALLPEILIADEPVSALDVSIQAQILELMAELQKNNGLTMIFISHDLRVVQTLCDRVAVMHQGKIVEQGQTHSVFNSPQHSYTRLLIESAPAIVPPKFGSTSQFTSASNRKSDTPKVQHVVMQPPSTPKENRTVEKIIQ